jgi:hypothetical protein
MVYFMCYSCGYLLRLNAGEEPPPHECPACHQASAFVNVTSYRPEVGEGNPDPQIMASLLKEAEKAKAHSAPRVRSLMESYHIDALCREAALIALRDLLEQKKKAGLIRVREPATT